MAGIYGNFWTMAYGENPIEELGQGIRMSDIGRIWFETIMEFDSSQVADGIARLRNENKKRPPTSLEFADLCKPNNNPAHQAFKKIPRPPANPELVQASIAEMRKSLSR